MPATSQRRTILYGNSFSPTKLSGLQLWLDASNQPSLQTDGACQFTANNNEWLQVADNVGVQFGAQDCTLGLWVRFDSLTATRAILAKESATAREFLLSASAAGALTATLYDGTTVAAATVSTANGTVTTNTWYFVVVTYTASTKALSISVNNGATTTTGAGTPGTTTGPLTLGFSTFAVQYMDGRLDSVGYWHRVLSAGEQTTLYNAGAGQVFANLTASMKTGMVSWWDLSEASGQRFDRFGSNHLNETFNPIISPTVLNGGFETAGTGGADVFASWGEGTAGTSTLTRDTTNQRSGAACCAMAIDASNSTANLTQSVMVAAKKYAYSVWAKAASGAPGLNITFGTGQTVSVTLSTLYQNFTGTVAAGSAPFGLSRGTGAQSNTLYSDDVTLTAAEVQGAVGITAGQATVSGDQVSTWQDQSGNGFNATQATGSARPTLQLASQNGRSVTQYDGINDLLKTATEIGGQSGLTVFAVANFSGGANNGQVVTTQKSGGTAGWRLYYVSNTSIAWRGGSIANGATTWICQANSVSTSGYRVLAGRFQPGTQDLYLDGTLAASAAIANAHDLASNGTAVGSLTDSSGQWLAGNIAEVIVYNRYLSDYERKAVESYLKRKWGTP